VVFEVIGSQHAFEFGLEERIAGILFKDIRVASAEKGRVVKVTARNGFCIILARQSLHSKLGSQIMAWMIFLGLVDHRHLLRPLAKTHYERNKDYN